MILHSRTRLRNPSGGLRSLFALVLIIACHGATISAEDAATAPSKEPTLRTYQDVLGIIPKELEPQDARHWSQAQREVANGILKKKLVEGRRTAAFRLRAEQVEGWPGLTLWANFPADEGYPIRFFLGRYKNADHPAKLAALHEGDSVLVEGVFDHVAFEDLWGGPSLSICLREGSFTKLASVHPAPAKVDLTVLSAVYGSGDQFADVTDRVKMTLEEAGTQFYANPLWLAADPTPGWNKALVIVYLHDHKRKIFTTGENGSVNAELLAQRP